MVGRTGRRRSCGAISSIAKPVSGIPENGFRYCATSVLLPALVAPTPAPAYWLISPFANAQRGRRWREAPDEGRERSEGGAAARLLQHRRAWRAGPHPPTQPSLRRLRKLACYGHLLPRENAREEGERWARQSLT